MNKKSSRKKAPRPYSSSLRADQAEATRVRILDAVMTLLKRGDRECSNADIAAEAGVAIPTVYRHFPSRDELFRAFHAHVSTHAEQQPSSWERDFSASARAFFKRMDDPADLLARSARLSVAFEFSRAATVPARRAGFTGEVEKRLPHLPEPQRTWLIDLGVVLLSMSTAEAFRGYLDRSGAETADRVLFALEALFAHAASIRPTPP